MKRYWCLPLLLLGACGADGGNAADTAIADTAVADTTVAVADTAVADTAIAGCSEQAPESCLYRPATSYDVAEPVSVSGITYTDVLGYERDVAVAIYRPVDAPTPAPVVVLSHGGSGGKTDPLKSMDQWAPTLTKAGYVAVAIAHPGRDQAVYAELCAALEVPTDIQCEVKIDWDRPHDVARVLDWLEEKAGDGGPYADALDLDHIAYMGHSAGGGCALMMAGAGRNYRCAQAFGHDQGTVVACDPADLEVLRDARIDVAVAMSPQGPGAAGFMTESFATVSIPLFTGTGANDGDPGEPDNRKGVFDALASSASGVGFTRLFVDDPGAKHTLFEAETDACAAVEGASLERCEELRSWLYSAVVAFLDWHVRGRTEAETWLRSSDLETASAGTVTWETK